MKAACKHSHEREKSQQDSYLYCRVKKICKRLVDLLHSPAKKSNSNLGQSLEKLVKFEHLLPIWTKKLILHRDTLHGSVGIDAARELSGLSVAT